MEATVPSKAVVAFVALILLMLAGFGAYQGWKRSSAGEQDAGEGAPALTAPIAGAKTASALAEPTAPVLTEAQVREIARQEARAALGKPETTSAPASTNADGTPAAASSGSTAAKPASPAAPLPTTPRPAPAQPALQTPAAPAPAGKSSQAPLF